jgi:hypothetical protein
MLLFFYFDKKWLGWKLFFNAEKPRPFCFLALVPIDRAEVNESGSTLAVDALSQVKHVLLPVTDRNPYLSEGTRQVHQFLQNTSMGYLYF